MRDGGKVSWTGRFGAVRGGWAADGGGWVRRGVEERPCYRRVEARIGIKLFLADGL